MNASGHRVIYLEDAELKIDRSHLQRLKFVSVRCNKCVPICYVGSQEVSRLFVSSLFSTDSGHFIDTKSQSVPLYSLPFIRKQRDLLLFDLSYLCAQSLYEKDLINRLCGSLSSVLVYSFDYSQPQSTLLEFLETQTPQACLFLRTNVPPSECNWSYQKSTESFLHRVHSSWFTSRSVVVVDIPSFVLSKVTPSNLPTFLEQSLLGFRSLIDTLTPCMPTTRFLSQLPFIIDAVNHHMSTSQSALTKTLLSAAQPPSSLLRHLFRLLWRFLAPDPSLSLSHALFGDDFYLRLQERISLVEELLVRALAQWLRGHAVEALAENERRKCVKNAAKILFAEIEDVSPCRGCLRVDRAKEGIEEVQNRAFFRNEKPDAIESLPCVCGFGAHENHVCVYKTIQKGWFRRREEVTWSGSFEGEFLRHDSHEELFERVEQAIRRSEEDSFFSLEEVAREFSTARQRVKVCEESQVETLHLKEPDAVFSPMCAVCFRELEEKMMMPMMEGSRRWSTAGNPRNQEYSRWEEGWLSQSVYLVRCRECTWRREGNGLFQRRQNAMALDGVPSTLIPSMSAIPLCSLCFRVLEYTDILRPPEAEPVHVHMNMDQMQTAALSRYMTRKLEEVERRRKQFINTKC